MTASIFDTANANPMPELTAFMLRAREEHPTLDPGDGFVTHVLSGLADHRPIAVQLSELRAGDLLLAYACMRAQPEALAMFEARHASVITSVCKSFRNLPEGQDDIGQMIRERLFVGSTGEPPKISLYRGQGALGGWCRVVATRLLVNLAQRETSELVTNDAVFDSMTANVNSPELALVKKTCATELRAAFGEAYERLSTRQRNLLRHQFVDELTASEVARIYRTHRSTIVRWLGETKSALEWELRASLERRLRLSASEVESVVRAALSELDLSLASLSARK